MRIACKMYRECGSVVGSRALSGRNAYADYLHASARLLRERRRGESNDDQGDRDLNGLLSLTGLHNTH
jgi:hypothetical protein